MTATVAHLAAFAGVATIVIVTPGPDTALTIRNALRGGRRGGVLTGAGVASGQAIWALAASVGLAAVVSASHPVFLAVRFAGVAFLTYLGLHSLWRAARGIEPEREPIARPGDDGRAYRQGLISNLGNPKMAVFFLSLLPQFAGHGSGSFVAMAGLGLVFAAMTFTWLCGYAAIVARVGDALQRTRARRLLDAATGAVLVGLAVRVTAD
jgi:threonine/homoserine/homoserine lactone efflux protein